MTMTSNHSVALSVAPYRRKPSPRPRGRNKPPLYCYFTRFKQLQLLLIVDELASDVPPGFPQVMLPKVRCL